MHPMRLRSGSRAETEQAERGAATASAWEEEWRQADAADRLEAARTRATAWRAAVLLTPAAALAGLVPGIFPLTPGFSQADTLSTVIAAAVTAAAAAAIVPLAAWAGPRLTEAGSRHALVFSVALFSAGAAAIHFAVAKMHFDEYALFGGFFVGSGMAQLAWAIWVLLRPWRPLLVLGAVGNGLVAALWAVARIWGLPLGPEQWQPEPVGFGDSVTVVFELLLAGGCLMLLARDRRRPLRASVAGALVLAVTAATTLSLLSVLGVGSSFLTPTE